MNPRDKSLLLIVQFVGSVLV